MMARFVRLVQRIGRDDEEGALVMSELCNVCGESVVKRLLHRSDAAAVFHRECANGHRQHRVTGRAASATEAGSFREQAASGDYIVIEPCDCDNPASPRPM